MIVVIYIAAGAFIILGFVDSVERNRTSPSLYIGAILGVWAGLSIAAHTTAYERSAPLSLEERKLEDGSSFQYVWYKENIHNVTKKFNKTFPKETKFVVKKEIGHWSLGIHFPEGSEELELEKNENDGKTNL